MPDEILLRAFQFRVGLSQSPDGAALGNGAFQECSGLEIEMEVKELQEGGNNDQVVRQAGRAKFSNLVLKRGMFYDGPGNRANAEFWQWLQGILSGKRPIIRCDGTIQLMSVYPQVAATWSFVRGLPVKLRGPDLNAKTGEVAIEELHIAHEGLRLEA
jgi:phage tail-like protein